MTLGGVPCHDARQRIRTDARPTLEELSVNRPHVVSWKGSRSSDAKRRVLLLLAAAVLLISPGCSREDAGTAEETAGDSAGARPREGRWRTAGDWETRGELTDEQRAEMERLQTLGYVGGVNRAPPQVGVTVHDRARAHPGLNFYTSGHFPGAILMDMEGNVLHTWELGFADVWPGRKYPDPADAAERWRRAYLYENGDVLAIFEGVGLIKLDRDSNLLWSYEGGAHHDLEVMDDGTIYVLTREAHIVSRINQNQPILEDSITILDADGNELRSVSILDAFRNSVYDRTPRGMKMANRGDITHANTLEVLDGRIADMIPAFRKGNVLVSFRKLNSIAVVDMDAEEVVWVLSGMWLAQHQPTVLENGNILIFDNGGNRGPSRVIEFDPVTQEIAWSYLGGRTKKFFSKSCGSNERLPNGNTLITESDNGRVFELTRDHEIVWDYRNPERAGEQLELIATIFEMVRLPADFPIGWAGGE
jgi:hypothetical protein